MFAMNAVHPIQSDDLQEARSFVTSVESKFQMWNVYSARGIGRTAFLQQVQKEFMQIYPTAFVNARDFVDQRKASSYRLDRLLSSMASQLYAWHQKDMPAKSDWMHNNIEDVLGLSKLLLEILYNVSQQNTRSLILIADYDFLPSGPKSVFESVILGNAIVQDFDLKVLLSTEQELQFTERFDLRLRLETWKLRYLTEKDIQKSMPEFAELAGEILEWSGGRPELMQFFVDEANRRQIVGLEEYRLQKHELLGHNYRKRVQETVFGDVQLATQEALDVIAVLRRFDVAILSAILPRVYPDIFSPFKQKHYLDLIRELGSRASWRTKGGYALDDMLKVMLASYTKAFEPKLYSNVHEIAAESYRAWLQNEYREHYLTEMLYHQMELDRLAQLEASVIQINLNRTLMHAIENLGEDQKERREILTALHSALVNDEDLGPFLTKELNDFLKLSM